MIEICLVKKTQEMSKHFVNVIQVSIQENNFLFKNKM